MLRLALSDWPLLARCFFGPHVAAQFRLVGPGATPAAARSTLMSFPSVGGRLINRISSALYAAALLLAALSLLLPLPSDARSALLPVGFPRLRRRLRLRLLTCAHCLAWARGAAYLLLPSLGSSVMATYVTTPILIALLIVFPVAAALGLEAAYYSASRRRVAELRAALLSRHVADAEWRLTCGKRHVKEHAE